MSDSQVQEIKQKADIVAVIDSRIKLEKSGRNLKAKCPFHGEKTPSFFVSPELQTFKCFGCGEGGDVYTFLQKYEGMDFPETLEYLAAKVGVKLEKGFRSGEEIEKKRLEEILHLASEYYAYLLNNHSVGKKALNYLKKREISKKTIEMFDMGYSADSWDGLIKFLVGKKKYKHEELEKVGMILKSHRGGGYYDRFRGRVMFPLKNMQGKVVGFSGRVLQKDAKEAKYINSPETILYHKSQMLFGLYEARKYIRRKDRVVIVEGELDMISSFGAGVQEVVAIKGSALTREQVELIRRLTLNIILALDADAAGSEATKRGIEIADGLGMNMSVVEVVDGKDPDELSRKDPEKWKSLVQNAISVYDFLINMAVKHNDVSTGVGKKKATKELVGVINRISHLVEREHYINVAAKAIGVSKSVFEEEVRRGALVERVEVKEEVKTGKIMSRRDKLERYVLGLYFQLNINLVENSKKIEEKYLSDTGLSRMWKEVLGLIKKNKNISKVSDLINKLPEEYQRIVYSLFESDVVRVDETEIQDYFDESIKDLELIVSRDRLAEVMKELESIEEESEDRKRLHEEYIKLTKNIRELENG